MESIENLRAIARFMAKGRDLENHEDCNLLLIICDKIEREIAERYMLLPVDADGVPIHLYDKLLKSTGAAKPTYGEVVGISDDSVFFNAKQGWESNWSKLTRHVKPDPLKELLSELANEVWEASCTCQTTWNDSGLDGIEERYAERIRDLMGVDR